MMRTGGGGGGDLMVHHDWVYYLSSAMSPTSQSTSLRNKVNSSVPRLCLSRMLDGVVSRGSGGGGGCVSVCVS